jgi:hypothetical protein
MDFAASARFFASTLLDQQRSQLPQSARLQRLPIERLGALAIADVPKDLGQVFQRQQQSNRIRKRWQKRSSAGSQGSL